MPAFAGTVTLRYSRPLASPAARAADDAPAAGSAAAPDRSQLAVAAVALVLGLLVVVQVRAQAGSAGLAQLSSQDLTVLVANLNARNDQLRREVSSLEDELGGAQPEPVARRCLDRRAARRPPPRPRLRRSRSGRWAWRDDLDQRPDRRIRRGGADQRAAQRRGRGHRRGHGPDRQRRRGLRCRRDPRRSAAPGLGRSFELSAIGAPDKLTGSLTRSGGVIAQLAATEPDVTVTVTPVDRIELPATTRIAGAGPRPSRAFDTLTRPMPDTPVLALLLGDVVRLRRPHPCGGDTWLVDRLGADIGLRCQTCGRHVLVERRRLEQRLVAFVSRGDAAVTAAARRPTAGRSRDRRRRRPRPPTAPETARRSPTGDADRASSGTPRSSGSGCRRPRPRSAATWSSTG